MLRVFLVADGRGDYRVMPGGLSRIAGEDRHVVSGQRGGGSKDTWVLSDAPVAPVAAGRAPRRGRARHRGERPDVEPRRRAPVLAGPLRRAQRELRAAAALGADAGSPIPTASRRAATRRWRCAPAARQGLLEPPSRATSPASRGSGRARARPDRRPARSPGAAQPRRSTSSRPCASPAPCAIACRPTTGGVLNRLLQLFARRAGAPLDLDDALELIDDAMRLAGRGRRARDGPHDPRRRLAVPQPGPPSRAAALRVAATLGDVAPEQASAGSGAARMAARAVGQPAHLPRPPHAAAGVGGGRRPAARSTSAIRDRRGSSWRSSPSTCACCPMPA